MPRRTDTEYVTDAQLAAARDEVADAWAREYADEASPFYAQTVRERRIEVGCKALRGDRE